jgi:hypothetical protein
VETTQYLAPVRRMIARWPALDRVFHRVAGHLTTWPADDFMRFVRTPIAGVGEPAQATAMPPTTEPFRPPEPNSIAPGTFEVRFSALQSQARYDEMWEMLAEDAQRSWRSRAAFIAGMKSQAADIELLETDVRDVEIVPEWTDRRRRRTYTNVAELTVRYRLRHQWRELTMDRTVHLVPAADGWRTLCYPP